ncbi:PAS domain-containing sensor histidine kinase [Aquimarina sp. MMG016]|uniref:sensor histidine kinase n=1 Tax=Aquimarina sp. MMG016 TaxID=2822690 RepID=UPI001B39D0F7|nr:PAS domain-containing sensor histidine kinase [Aquimarina sp. MMG016]MBQ4819661.1 PAS domain S-box protein [Aquimarina sp. MMG016]
MKVFEKNNNIFKLLSEAVSEGIIVVNKDQIIVATNGSANDMFGYGTDELLGKSLNILIPQKYHKEHKGHFKTFVDHSESRKMGIGRELFGVRKNGDIFPVEAGLNPFTIYQNDYVMALVMDITIRKKAEQELKHWATIFDESLNEIFIFDAESLKFIDVNRGAQKNIGYSLEELKELTPVDIKPGYTEPKFLGLIEPLLQKIEEKLQFETVHQRKDGTTYPVEVHLQLSTLGDQAVFVAIIVDITERKHYTEKLEKTVKKRTQQLSEALAKEKDLNELKTKFLSLVSHEFKTPLSGILTSTTLIGKYTKTEQQEKRDKHLATIKNKVKYLDNILNDFLSVERLESGKVNYKFTTFPLSKVINEVIYDANMLLKDGQRIKYPQNIDDYIIDFDEKILELVLTNLIRNAIKYSGENTTIDLQAVFENNLLTFHIIDQGIGIPEKEQEFIFKRYFRAENALLDQGTGIGLNIVKTHLENLGGNIIFTSKENQGSTFTVQIPIAK